MKTEPLSEANPEIWHLRLYVAGQALNSKAAIKNLQNICAEYLPGQHQIEVIDLVEQPHFAALDQIIAVPTLIKLVPEPLRKIIGDLSNPKKVLMGLQLQKV